MWRIGLENLLCKSAYSVQISERLIGVGEILAGQVEDTGSMPLRGESSFGGMPTTKARQDQGEDV
jgi:hypothetical protein